MDSVALNPFSRKFYDFLVENEPSLAALAEVDHSFSWCPGTLRLALNNLSLSTLDASLRIFFGPMPVSPLEFDDALMLLRRIQRNELLVVEWLEEDRQLCCLLVEAGSVLDPPGPILGSPTHARFVSFDASLDGVRHPTVFGWGRAPEMEGHRGTVANAESGHAGSR